MAIAGTASKYFLTFMVILLLKTFVVESQGFPETARYTEKFSHGDDRPNHSRQKRETSISAIEYIVVVEVNISQAIMLEQLKSSLNSFSLQIMESTNISAVGLTTVCQLYKNLFQCRCESQYAWPCDKCLTYGHCDDIVNSSCGCINAIPNDGLLCQPLKDMANATCPAPPQTTVILPTKPPLLPTVPPTTPKETTIRLSLTLDENFDIALTNPTSAKYIRYKTNIQKAIDVSYTNMVGYIPGSVTIFRFRRGSVIADFIINTTKNELDFASANTQLTSKLNDIGFTVDSKNAFYQSDEYNLLQNSGKIYPLQDMELNCGLPAADIKWRVNEIDPSSKPEKYIIFNKNRTLKVKSMSALDKGRYECITLNNSLKIIQWQDITVQPFPNIKVDSNKMLKCDDFYIPLQCCAQSSYTIEWIQNYLPGPLTPPGQGSGCITYNYAVQKSDCQSNDKIVTFTCQLSDVNLRALSYGSKNITISTTKKVFDCTDNSFGIGTINQVASRQCDGDQVGTQWAVCTSTGWIVTKQDCTLRAIQELTDKVEMLNVQEVPQFVANLSDVAKNNSAMVAQANFSLIKVVDLLSTVTSVLKEKSFTVDKTVMTHFLKTVDIITSKDAQSTWQSLNKGNSSQNTSSSLLRAIENIAGSLSEEQFSITNMENIQLSKTNFAGPFRAVFHVNSTSQVDIPETNRSHSITILVFSSLSNILPIRNAASSDSIQTGTSISGDVMVINTEPRINNISLSYSSKNRSLGNPQCVFWNFNLLDGIGGWDSTGCELKSFRNQSDSLTCECNHTTSFSILMSPFFLDNPALAYITYIGIGISIASLVLCLLIEILIWKSAARNDTSYMRHVSIVNIALSLLIADICFIIGAAIVKTGEKPPVGPCSALTFFIHFFYLALFFWMLISALLLLYRVIMVFSRMSRAMMMAIAFNVGYGAPLTIAIITVASTAGHGGYIHDGNGCWLNWDKTKALLAFVIPALTIVVINLLVLVVIISKILRSGAGATTQPDEKHTIAVVARCVGILTPLFGLTWGFGIGTMVSSDFGIHVVFAFLNSLQGFFILVFGTLLDNKILEGLLGKMRNLSSTFTVSTNPGPSSVTGHRYTHRFPKRYGYNISEAACSSAAPSSNLESIKFFET